MSKQIFASWECDLFQTNLQGGSVSYLRSDLGVRCNDTSEHSALTGVALCLIFLWPVGFVVFFGVVLFGNREKILARGKRGHVDLWVSAT